MAVFPESMDRLNPDDVPGSLKIIENYVRYIGERIEFAFSNTTRNVSAAGVSSVELYNRVVKLSHDISALESSLNTFSSTVTSLQTEVVSHGQQIQNIKTNLGSAEQRLSSLEENYTSLEGRVAALEAQV